MSLYLQQLRGLSSLGTDVAFLPMMLIGAVLTPLSARIAERLGARVLITGGLILMTAGLAILAVLPAWTPVWALAVLMPWSDSPAPWSCPQPRQCCSTASRDTKRAPPAVCSTPAAKSAAR
jgi:predicted MFS family arabinose efflux permease